MINCDLGFAGPSFGLGAKLFSVALRAFLLTLRHRQFAMQADQCFFDLRSQQSKRLGWIGRTIDHCINIARWARHGTVGSTRAQTQMSVQRGKAVQEFASFA